METVKNDAIYPSTRIVAAILIPFLVLAFVILYFFPEDSGERFAWRIWPPVMAAYVGAGYLGGAYLFLRALFGRRWHRVAAGFPAVTVFAICMLLITYLHWNRYYVDHFPFQLWLGLYIVAPVLVPVLWLRNRMTDPEAPEPNDMLVPKWFRWLVFLFGLMMSLIVILGFVYPSALMDFWPWQLSELTARLLAGWGALLAVANIYISFEPRWSAWRIGVESIALWHALFLVAAVIHREDFTGSGLFNWYALAVLGILLFMVAAYLFMERAIRRAS